MESFPFSPQTSSDENIIDLRDPDKAEGSSQAWRSPWVDLKTPRTHVVLTKAGSILFFYGDKNTISWKEVLHIAQSQMDTSLQNDYFAISVKGNGYLIDRSRETGNWSGDRNKYSDDVYDIVKALLDRGLATLSTPIWIGNWAAGSGEHIGNVGSIIKKAHTTTRNLTLFHGTDTFRLKQIMKSGLRPMAFDDRVWNKTSLDKVRPAHREDSIYLTASKPQAEYYAKKAVKIDRVRFGPSNRKSMRQKVEKLQRTANQYKASLERWESMTPEQIAAEDAHAKKYDHSYFDISSKIKAYPKWISELETEIAQLTKFDLDFYDKIEPVILQITIPKKDFSKLMADDDHLRQNPTDDPTDWQKSLSHFGQVAFRGNISPDKIKIIASSGNSR